MERLPQTSDTPVVGRFAPTPSGRMHVGNVFSALIAWLAVRSASGTMVLRIEDLDPRSSNVNATEPLIEDLKWLGFDFDEGPYYQSERLEVYAEELEKLKETGLVYPCFCTRAELHAASAPHASDGTYVYPGTCRHLPPSEIAIRGAQRHPALRIAVPRADERFGTISFSDLVYGPLNEVLERDCGDFLVRRSDGVFSYQFAVVVDDGLMGINQVVRGRDLLGSCARQIYLYDLLGFEPPTFGHVPLLTSQDGRRLSKRDKDLDLGAIRERDKNPMKLIGWLGSHIGLCEAKEELSAADLIDRFSWEKVRSAAHMGDICAYTYS